MNRRVRVGSVVASVLIAGLGMGAVLLPVPAGAGGATCAVTAEDLANETQELEFLRLINEYRQANGKLPLALHPDATRAAAWFSHDMATNNYLPPDHVDLNGRNPAARLTWCGVSWTAYAENIYAGTVGSTAQAAFDWWRNSPGHNTNMLRDTVKFAGIARSFWGPSSFDWYWALDLVDTARYEFPPADFDGSGTTDVAVYRPSNRTWFVNNGPTVNWGAAGDIPVPGDYDGNGTIDVAVFRPSSGTWLVRGGAAVNWGGSGDIPVPADFDGNGTTDVAVFRPSSGTWFVRNGATVPWGGSGDIPVPGDYDGSGDDEIAVFRPSANTWFLQGGPTTVWGASGDIPVPGDYDADGDTDRAVFRPSTGVWFVQGGLTAAWGASGDVPVPGDYDGDGDTDAAVFRPASGTWFVRNGATVGWGTSGDHPLPLPAAIKQVFFP